MTLTGIRFDTNRFFKKKKKKKIEKKAEKNRAKMY